MGYIAGIGGANVDIHGQSLAPIIMRDSNPGKLHTSMGGVVRNVLENCARLGLKTQLASAVGDDDYGVMLRRSCERLGIGTDCLFTRPGQNSSCYISIMDGAGDMLVAMSDMRIMKTMDGSFVENSLEMLNGADLVACDGNLSPEAIAALTELCKKPLYLDPVSTTWAQNLKPWLGSFDTIKPNRMEMEVLADMSIRTESDLRAACQKVRGMGVRQLFVSLGADGIYYQGPAGELRGRSHDFTRMTNATGAGDATMAGIIYATANGFGLKETLDFALGCGIVAVSSSDTINPDMSVSTVYQNVKEFVL